MFRCSVSFAVLAFSLQRLRLGFLALVAHRFVLTIAIAKAWRTRSRVMFVAPSIDVLSMEGLIRPASAAWCRCR